jgi:hypothetical protein
MAHSPDHADIETLVIEAQIDAETAAKDRPALERSLNRLGGQPPAQSSEGRR